MKKKYIFLITLCIPVAILGVIVFNSINNSVHYSITGKATTHTHPSEQDPNLIPSIDIESLGYSNQEAGSWRIDKSAKWTSNTTAEVTLKLTSKQKTRDALKRDIVLILDISGSMEGNKIEKLKHDSIELIDDVLNNPENTIALISYSTESRIVHDFTNDKTELINYINDAYAVGETNYNAPLKNLDTIIENYQKQDDRELIALFLTDGFPNVDTPNEVATYKVIKTKHPYIHLNGIQYEMGARIQQPLIDTTDMQWVADINSLNNVLFDATKITYPYEKLQISDTINTDYFSLDGSKEITATKGTTEVDDSNGTQKVKWNIDGDYSGQVREITIPIKFKDGYTPDIDYYPTNKSETIDYILDGEEEDNVATDNTPNLKYNYAISYDYNAPGDCSIATKTEKHPVYSNVTISNETPICENYAFRGWTIIDDVQKINDDMFVMPDYDVAIRAEWSKLSISKSMDGVVNENNNEVYSIARIDYNRNFGAKLYEGKADDSLDGSGDNAVYYYQGGNLNNNLIFANMCWLIVRTTSTGGTKILYNGLPDAEGQCNNTGRDSAAYSPSSYVINGNSEPFGDIGYMHPAADVSVNYKPIHEYGTTSTSMYYAGKAEWDGEKYILSDTSNTMNEQHLYSCGNKSTSCEKVRFYYRVEKNAGYVHAWYIYLADGQTPRDALIAQFTAEDVNQVSSTRKTQLEDWFANNLSGFNDYLEDNVYCSDRTLRITNTVWDENAPEGSLSNTFRLGTFDESKPSLECQNETDKFTTNNPKAKTNYRVGLLTNNEVALAQDRSTEEKNNYLNSGRSYYLMDPYGNGSGGISMYKYVYSYDSNERILGSGSTNDVRPVVSLMPGTIYTDGNGTKETPYIVTQTRKHVITFIYNNGSISESYRLVLPGQSVGELPTSSKNGFILDGWFTESGDKVDRDTIPEGDITYYAHWSRDDNSLYAIIRGDMSDYMSTKYEKEAADSFADNNDSDVYYYNVDNPNNNIIFAGYCWKMYRTTSDGGVRIIYNGSPTNGTCAEYYKENTPKSIFSNHGDFYHSTTSDVGYMSNANYLITKEFDPSASTKFGKSFTYANGKYTLTDATTTLDNNHHYSCGNSGTICETIRYYIWYDTKSTAYSLNDKYYHSMYITLTNGESINDAVYNMFDAENVNSNDSTIKENLEKWYKDNLTDYSSFIIDSTYCNDRRIEALNGLNPNGGNLKKMAKFVGRTNTDIKCAREIDSFSVNNQKAKLNYPIGLISAPEAEITSAEAKKIAKYLGSSNTYHTLTPIGSESYFTPSMTTYGNSRINAVYSVETDDSALLRPVITLHQDTIASSGDGSSSSPYTVSLSNNRIHVIFKPNYGEINEADQSRIITSGSAIGELPNVSRLGHNFVGWYDSLEEGGQKITAETVPDSDKTYYAKWTPIEGNHLYNIVLGDTTTGQGYKYTDPVSDTLTDSNEPVYIYHGNEAKTGTKNHIIFNNMCWLMMRTTQTGGIKIIYNGVPDNGACTATSSNNYAFQSAYANSSDLSLSSVGYMYKDSSLTQYRENPNGMKFAESVTYNDGKYTLVNPAYQTYPDKTHHYTCGNSIDTECETVRFYSWYYSGNPTNANSYMILEGGELEPIDAISKVLYAQDVNQKDSLLKTNLENWFENNLASKQNLLEDTVFCYDRTIEDLKQFSPTGETSGTSSKFGRASIFCQYQTDRFSISNDLAKIKYPVGVLNGKDYTNAATTGTTTYNYLISASYRYSGYSPNASGGGSYSSSLTTTQLKIQPVVSLKPGIQYISGDGSSATPYIVKEDE